MERVFSSFADLSNISHRPLRLENVLQKCTIEVSEDGQNEPEIIIGNNF